MNIISRFLFLGSVLLIFLPSTYAFTALEQVKNVVSSSQINTSSTYVFSFVPSTQNIKHIRVEFHTTNPLDYTPVSTTSLPDISAATFQYSSSSLWTDAGGIAGNIQMTSNGTNTLTLSRTDAGPYILTNALRTLTISGIVQPASSGILYATISTYTTDGQLVGGVAQSVEKGNTSTAVQEGIHVSGFLGTTFYFGIDDSNVIIKSNSDDNSTDTDPAVRAALSFGTLLSGVFPSEHPITGMGKDGHKLMISTNSPRGYVITLADQPQGMSLPLTPSSERSIISHTNGVLDDFGQTIIDGTQSGSNLTQLQNLILTGSEVFTFSLVSGPAPSLVLNTFYSLQNSSVSPAKLAEFAGPTASEHVYYVEYFATKHTDTPGGTYSDTLTYTAVPAL